MWRSLTFLALTLSTLSLARRPPPDGRNPRHHPPSYDYVIIGGGTSGLAVANRLTENPGVNVLVIEAGGSVLNNPNVTDLNGYGTAFGTDIDWQYETTNQTFGGNLRQTVRAGKALSGTSAINGMAYTRVEDVQIDTWQAIGNEGWTWQSLFPYYKKSENLTIPTQTQQSLGVSYNPEYHGEDGPLKVGWVNFSPNNLTATVNQTFEQLAVPWSEDINGGHMRGINIYPATINYAESVREDAARAYYWPYQSRGNLHVMLHTFANRILWAPGNTNSPANARGVEITSANGTVSVIGVKQEVIVSAGALKSPGILELSGIGNPAILGQHNISVRVDLPTVGENLQDQVNSHLGATAYSNLTGAKYVIYPNAEDVFGNESQTVAATLQASLAQYARDTAEVNGNVTKAADLEEFFQAQYDLIFNKKVPIAEILIYPGGGTALSAEFWSLLPFARGSVHISSSDSFQHPTINPNYFQFDWDSTSYIAIAKYIRKAFQTAPMSNILMEEATPGFSIVAEGASDEAWKAWVLDGNYRSNFHPIGTAAMMPRSVGGVVDDNLKVYGTSNVRVVDASVLPFQVCGHLVSTLYAVAERVSDIIKQESPLFKPGH